MSDSETDLAYEVEDEKRSRSTSNRPNYAIDTEDLDIDENDENEDDDYREEEINEGPHEEEVSDEEEHINRSGRNKRKRTDEEEDLPEEKGVSRPGVRSRSKRPVFSGIDDSDESLNSLPVVNEEYVLPDDSEGETKITADGDLLGGREFLVRTFTLTEKGSRKFMLATEPARLVGFRDSYLFFQTHPNLYKFILNQTQKNDLIDRGVLPYSYRNRQIALVTARGVFKEFGAKIIRGGKHITDDYYASELRTKGNVIEGKLAGDPVDKSARALENTLYPVSENGINPAKNQVEFFEHRPHGHMSNSNIIASGSKLSSTNWLYQHSAACSRFNSDLFYDRVKVLLVDRQGLRDAYTNTLHIPQSTQSTAVLGWKGSKNDNPGDTSITYETVIHDSDLNRPKTGLWEIQKQIYEDVVEEDVLKAITEQQDFEKSDK
ncbi:Npl6p SKDI_13G2210 [Saccharomyces kudriavzevii IFO 1802]|uniref:NPL6-like protein n=2 Tax=Saccharomyces kudriavzevii (strain ATCC MYA-4449 / AS 2.2408 / CBS 8840 / NBRC 1802 / NCYC 2889) TaxID=226230 RepID=J4TW47_SACK1|nr:uncharacterized protein SKDI_13G2210 [Saccharomyces kudriavzevii IFO 1802]EJT42450.1 NPL6-like protein [Saccharomyces kudriavzevii IFO 1802]CAI4048228.1 hypothetical protein SKDI_13G2210 [Saccharomyces kudriavzevii IFO 1802]